MELDPSWFGSNLWISALKFESPFVTDAEFLTAVGVSLALDSNETKAMLYC